MSVVVAISFEFAVFCVAALDSVTAVVGAVPVVGVSYCSSFCIKCCVSCCSYFVYVVAVLCVIGIVCVVAEVYAVHVLCVVVAPVW